MNRHVTRGLAACLLLAAATRAADERAATTDRQAAHQHHPSPYAGDEDSGIAGLTPREIEELRQGHGMGLAKPAELNHYPGPKHVLELAGELGLAAETRAAVEQIYARMAAEARRIGTALIAAEEHLDLRFRHRHVDAASLRQSTAAIGELRGELRFVHLVAHLETAALLTPEQIATYDRLRGYDSVAVVGP